MKMIILILAVLTALTVFETWPREKYHTFKGVIQKETVVLLHGLCRTSRSMAKMEKALKADGYHVINVDYPSRSATVEELTGEVFEKLIPILDTRHPVHFVTHSMGGVLLSQYLEKQAATPWLGNVVMLAPPSRGSEVPDKLGGLKIYQWINGPAGNQLGTDSHPLRLNVPEMKLGVIAGDRSINPILSMLIPGPDDGKVSVARVKPAACTDYLQLHVTHACMMRNQQVIEETIAFLKNGAFNKAGRTPANRTAGILPAQTEGDIK